jgi:hypothetical protein
MDVLLLLRTFGALAAVLALLAGALWAVRRYDLTLPGRIGGRKAARLELTERLNLDPKRSVALVRHGSAEHLLLLAPEGNMLLGETSQVDDTPLFVELGACREHNERPALHIDLALCRTLATPVPPPPAPPPLLWPAPPRFRRRPAQPPLPAIRRA